MDQCVCVERELEKVLHKFLMYGQHCDRSLEELLHYVSGLRQELSNTGEHVTALCTQTTLIPCSKYII